MITRNIRGKKVLIIFILLSTTILYCIYLVQQSTKNAGEIEKIKAANESFEVFKTEIPEKSAHVEKFYILFWNDFFGSKSWGMKVKTSTEEDLTKLNCSVTNCIFTIHKKVLPNIQDFDALLVHPWLQQNLNLPIVRSPRQLYIVAAKEYDTCMGFEIMYNHLLFRAPNRIFHDFSLDANVFNLTMTHRLDSDIPWPYGETIDKSSGEVIAPNLNVRWKDPFESFQDDEILQIVKNKTKEAVWIVSNCFGQPSKRNELVKKLQQLNVDVDIYGECGNLTLLRKDVNKFLEKTYKFYFAFENTLCIDYITEKLFKVMNSFMIPVVYSGADVSRFVPPKSYIDANAYATAEELADYLKFLSDNPEEYVKYFWWKQDYEVRRYPANKFPCKVCEKLNELRLTSEQKLYPNIKKWMNKKICNEPKIKF